VISPELKSTGDSSAVGLVYAIRPWQWYKQLILYIAIVFSGSAGDVDIWLRVTAGAVLFSAVAGATYVFNDISDVEEDRRHPRKRHRPIASGAVSLPLAITFALSLYVGAGVLSWRLNPLFTLLILVYVLQNFVYSAVLKHILFVDLFSISAGFVIRAVAGVVIVGSPLSPWLLLCTFLAALLLGVSKRWGQREELADPTLVKRNLDGYSPKMSQFMFVSVATTLMISYSMYTFFARNIEMMLTIPFAFFATFRFAHLTFTKEGSSDPTELLIDPTLLLSFIAWGIIAIVFLYDLIPGAFT
jgi:4-hydroxybenzoate polyprenyltransferase